jgi:hypothetical protein
MNSYKFLRANNVSEFQNCAWPLPVKNDDGTWTPGEWMPAVEGNLAICENGYHLTDANHLLDWCEAQLFEAEYRGDVIEGDNKVVVREARLTRKIEGWNDKNLRLFAVWCAREALKLIDNPDPRSINVCDVAVKHAGGEVTDEELSAAWTAAGDAARDAAWDAARDAAWDAARAAAWDALDAASAAQYKKLWEMIGL